MLGKSTFADSGDDPSETIASVGANWWGYSEIYPSASVTNFREFAVSLNDAGIIVEKEPST